MAFLCKISFKGIFSIMLPPPKICYINNIGESFIPEMTVTRHDQLCKQYEIIFKILYSEGLKMFAIERHLKVLLQKEQLGLPWLFNNCYIFRGKAFVPGDNLD